jgi:hypothetical protein
MRKCGIFYMVGFYSATKKNEILSFADKQMKLENIILSEVSQIQKAKSQVFSHMWNIDLTQIQQYYEKQVTQDGEGKRRKLSR